MGHLKKKDRPITVLPKEEQAIVETTPHSHHGGRLLKRFSQKPKG